MSQEIINIGAAPDDGDGDNLRTAFNKTNENFTQIWTAGPVGSNVRIQGNTISTLQVNQDLRISPNGTGNIRLNNNTIPGANNTWFLGSTTNRWRGLYVGNVDTNSLSIANVANLSIGGGVNGYVLQTNGSGVLSWVAQGGAGNGNPGGANTQIQFNDAGSFGGSTDLIFNKNTNTLTVNGTLTALDATVYGQVAGITGVFSGNVTANYFIGNGSRLNNITGANVVGLANVAYSGNYNDLTNKPALYGNSNVTTLLANFGSNTVVTTGNITAGYFLGNGSQLTGIETGAVISNTAPALGTGGIWWNSVDGRAYVKYNNQFIDMSPSLVPDPTTYVGNVSFEDITVTNVGNIIPAASNTYSLGSAAFQWKDLWVSNNTIYINSVPLTLSAGNVLEVNGTPVGSTGSLGFNYELGDRLISGEFETNNSTPSDVSTISINPTDQSGIDLDVLMTYMNNKDIVVTIGNGNNQAQFNVDSIQPFVTAYNGFKAVYTKQWGDDPGFSKIAFFKDTATATATTQTDTDDDEFTVNITSGNSDLLGLAIIYTDNEDFIPTNDNLVEYFEYFVDNVLTPASGNISGIQANFYSQIANTSALISEWGEDPWNLEFYDNGVQSIYNSVASTTSGSGTGFTANIIPAGDGSYRIRSFINGTGYQVGDIITFDGADLGGISNTNDFSLTVATVNGAGGVLTFSDIGTSAGVWPTDYISDGGSDIYDDGNYLQTNLEPTVPYSDGIIQNSGAFGANEWFVGYAYGQFVFFGDNTGNPVSTFGTYGETGADGDGFRETGDLSPVQYYDLSVDSVLNYTPGMTITSASPYQITFDVAGPDTNGVVFDQNNVNTITTNSGDLYLKAADDVRIQPRDLASVRGGDKLPGLGNQGGRVNISGGTGSAARNTVGNEIIAGTGGDVEIYGGQGGGNDGNISLGRDGGRVYIEGGPATGNLNGGEVRLIGGQGSGSGVRGNVVIDSGNGTWLFDAAGNLTLPTNGSIVVDGGDGVIGPDGDDMIVSWDNEQLILRSVQDDVVVEADQTFQIDTNYNSSYKRWIFDSNGHLVHTTGDTEIRSEQGNLALGGGLNGLASGNVSILAVDVGVAVNTWSFDNDGNTTIPGNSTVSVPAAVGGAGGYSIDIRAGAADQGDYYTTAGGNVNIIGGLGAYNDGGGGGPGGDVNITAGASADPAGHAGNVNIAAGSNNWVFDYTGNLTMPGGTVTNVGSLVAVVASPAPAISGFAISGSPSISASGNITTTANISGGNLITTGTFESASISSTGNITSGAGRHLILGNATSSMRQTGSNATVNLNGSISLTPDTGASALNGVIIGGNGYLLASSGARVLTLGTNNALTVAGNLTLGGSTGFSRFTTLGETTTGVNAVVAGPSPTILANSSATFAANVNNYTQITFQNRNTGADATADFILTADNGNDTTNYADFGIINSGYDNSTPTNSLGNIVFAADTYVYAQGNVSNASQSGGNLVIGTTTAGKNIKLFAGGNTASALVANISNIGISQPNLVGFRVTGAGNTVNLSNTVNSTGNLNINNFAVDYNQGSYLNTATGVFTAPVAGLYSVHLVARVSGNNNATSQISVMKNGSTQQAFWEVAANSTVGHMGVSTVAKLAVGDTLVAKVLLGTINFDTNDSWSVAFLG